MAIHPARLSRVVTVGGSLWRCTRRQSLRHPMSRVVAVSPFPSGMVGNPRLGRRHVVRRDWSVACGVVLRVRGNTPRIDRVRRSILGNTFWAGYLAVWLLDLFHVLIAEVNAREIFDGFN